MKVKALREYAGRHFPRTMMRHRHRHVRHGHYAYQPRPLEIDQLAHFDATLGDLPEEEKRRHREFYLRNALDYWGIPGEAIRAPRPEDAPRTPGPAHPVIEAEVVEEQPEEPPQKPVEKRYRREP